MNKEKLIKKAFEAQQYSYSPYSHFAVGASLLTTDGTVILGANIENASYGLTMCAERNALFAAYGLGYKKEDIVAIAITANCTPLASPCGACRQVISELVPLSTPIFLANDAGDERETTPEELLPFAFGKESL